MFHDDIALTASVAARAFDLVDEFRWRFDCAALSFRERIAGSPVPYLASLVILGVDFGGDFMLYATRDLWASDVLVHAQIDAGGRLLEASGFQPLFQMASVAGLEKDLLQMRNEITGTGGAW